MKLDDSFDVLANKQSVPSDRVLRDLQRELGATPTKTRHPARHARLGWSAVCLFAGLVCTTWGLRGKSLAHLFAVALLVSVICVGWLFPRTLPGPTRRMPLGSRQILTGAMAMGLLLALAAAAQFFSSWGDALHAPSLVKTVACLLHATGTGGLIAAGLVLIWRKTDPFTPSWTGALFGAVGGLVGAASVSFMCASCEGWHMMVGHGAGIVLLMILGGLAGNRWLQP